MVKKSVPLRTKRVDSVSCHAGREICGDLIIIYEDSTIVSPTIAQHWTSAFHINCYPDCICVNPGITCVLASVRVFLRDKLPRVTTTLNKTPYKVSKRG